MRVSEVIKVCLAANCSIGYLIDIFVGFLPPLFHCGIAVFICALATGIKTGSTRIEQVYDTAVFLCLRITIMLLLYILNYNFSCVIIGKIIIIFGISGLIFRVFHRKIELLMVFLRKNEVFF